MQVLMSRQWSTVWLIVNAWPIDEIIRAPLQRAHPSYFEAPSRRRKYDETRRLIGFRDRISIFKRIRYLDQNNKIKKKLGYVILILESCETRERICKHILRNLRRDFINIVNYLPIWSRISGFVPRFYDTQYCRRVVSIKLYNDLLFKPRMRFYFWSGCWRFDEPMGML